VNLKIARIKSNCLQLLLHQSEKKRIDGLVPGEFVVCRCPRQERKPKIIFQISSDYRLKEDC
jgi:hypothetical protein